MSSSGTTSWYKIAANIEEINFSSNGLATIEIASKKVCVGLHNHTIFACTHTCPHAGALIADGSIDKGGNIVCPLHHYRFSTKNGRNVSGEGYFLKTYKVEVRKEGVFIEIANSSLFG